MEISLPGSVQIPAIGDITIDGQALGNQALSRSSLQPTRMPKATSETAQKMRRTHHYNGMPRKSLIPPLRFHCCAKVDIRCTRRVKELKIKMLTHGTILRILQKVLEPHGNCGTRANRVATYPGAPVYTGAPVFFREATRDALWIKSHRRESETVQSSEACKQKLEQETNERKRSNTGSTMG